MKRKKSKKMPSTVVFGDIHGSTFWEKVVEIHPDCHYIFLGDYIDPYEDISCVQLIDNLKKIIEFKKEHEEEVILLLGNHDLHYFCSDISPSWRFDFSLAEEVSTLFRENIHLFTYAYQIENCIFTHAGISEKWFLEDFKGDVDKNIAEQLNSPLEEQVAALCRCGKARGGNEGDIGGIFWADLSELNNPLPGFTQVVGHNRVNDICDYTNNGGRLIFCDCFFNEKYLKLDF